MTNAREVAKDHDIGFKALKAPRRAAKHAFASTPGAGIFHEQDAVNVRDIAERPLGFGGRADNCNLAA
jgi:hypothetical protein